jgi:hypothetical protein
VGRRLTNAQRRPSTCTRTRVCAAKRQFTLLLYSMVQLRPGMFTPPRGTRRVRRRSCPPRRGGVARRSPARLAPAGVDSRPAPVERARHFLWGTFLARSGLCHCVSKLCVIKRIMEIVKLYFTSHARDPSRAARSNRCSGTLLPLACNVLDGGTGISHTLDTTRADGRRCWRSSGSSLALPVSER